MSVFLRKTNYWADIPAAASIGTPSSSGTMPQMTVVSTTLGPQIANMYQLVENTMALSWCGAALRQLASMILNAYEATHSPPVPVTVGATPITNYDYINNDLTRALHKVVGDYKECLPNEEPLLETGVALGLRLQKLLTSKQTIKSDRTLQQQVHEWITWIEQSGLLEVMYPVDSDTPLYRF